MTLMIISPCRVAGLMLTESSDTLHIRERKPIRCNNTFQAFLWLQGEGKTWVHKRSPNESIDLLWFSIAQAAFPGTFLVCYS